VGSNVKESKIIRVGKQYNKEGFIIV
jgi:hypothetical protein